MDEIRCKIELRESEGKPSRLVGVLMPYNTEARDRREVFEVGSLSWPADGVTLRRQHDRQSPIMQVLPVVEGNEVRIDQQLPETQAGREAAIEIRQGLFKGLSVEFRATAQTIVLGVRRISAALLVGAGLVDVPSFSQATVEARAKVEKDMEWARWQREMVL